VIGKMRGQRRAPAATADVAMRGDGESGWSKALPIVPGLLLPAKRLLQARREIQRQATVIATCAAPG